MTSSLFAEGDLPEWAKYLGTFVLALCGGSLIPLYNKWITWRKVKSKNRVTEDNEAHRRRLEELKEEFGFDIGIDEANEKRLAVVVVELRKSMRDQERHYDRMIERMQRDQADIRQDLQTSFNRIAIVQEAERKCTEKAAMQEATITYQRERIEENAVTISDQRERISELTAVVEGLKSKMQALEDNSQHG